MEHLITTESAIALVTLTLLEIVLGIDKLHHRFEEEEEENP